MLLGGSGVLLERGRPWPVGDGYKRKDDVRCKLNS